MSVESKTGISRRTFVLSSTGIAAIPMAGLSPLMAAETASRVRPGPGRNQPFDFDWMFSLGSGEGREAAQFDDSAWRRIDLPHDWSIEELGPKARTRRIGPIDADSEGGLATAFSIGGEGWYRKAFDGSAIPVGSRVAVNFDGIYGVSDIYFNGALVATNVHGYVPFRVDLTPGLRPGSNVIAVQVRNEGKNSRWYSGSGIYRGVTLDVTGAQGRIAPDGVFVWTTRIDEESAAIAIATDTEDTAPGDALVYRVRDRAGAVVGTVSKSSTSTDTATVILRSPALWSPEEPSLYVLETELRRGEQLVDRVDTSFGVRIVSFDSDRGMHINGKPTKLRGGCVHHDNGLLGAAAYPDAEERRVRMLKARGYNAVRSSHNPSSAAFRSACDRLGMLLIEEAFDMWHVPKNPQDYAQHFDRFAQRDIANMVRSSRNSPSVIMWSIGNEIPGRLSAKGQKIAWDLADTVRRIDPTRPVTAAINGFGGRPVIADADAARPGRAGLIDDPSSVALDVVGYNYKAADYAPDHARFPKRVIYGSESYPRDVFSLWKMIDQNDYLVGDFVWTAIDYRGETGIGSDGRKDAKTVFVMPVFPQVTANCGDIDLVGAQRPQSYARDVVWNISPLEMAVQRPVPEGITESPSLWGWSDEVQSWTWPGSEGRDLLVRIYCRADRVELTLNNNSVGSKAIASNAAMPIEFSVPYAPGVLEAVAYVGDKIVTRRTLGTTGKAAKIAVLPETRPAAAKRGDLMFVRLEIVDAKGNRVPDAAETLRLSIAGPAELVAFGNGGQLATGSLQAPITRTFDGRALAVLRSTGKPGPIKLTLRADGLASGTSMLRRA